MNFFTVPRLALVSIHRDVKKIECVRGNDSSNNIAVTVTTYNERPDHSEQQAVACCR